MELFHDKHAFQNSYWWCQCVKSYFSTDSQYLQLECQSGFQGSFILRNKTREFRNPFIPIAAPPVNYLGKMCVCVCVCVCGSCSVVSDSLQPYGLQPSKLLCPWDSPGQNTGVSCHSLLQEIYPTQGSNPGLPHCGQMLYRLSHRGQPLFGKDKYHLRKDSLWLSSRYLMIARFSVAHEWENIYSVTPILGEKNTSARIPVVIFLEIREMYKNSA